MLLMLETFNFNKPTKELNKTRNTQTNSDQTLFGVENSALSLCFQMLPSLDGSRLLPVQRNVQLVHCLILFKKFLL